MSRLGRSQPVQPTAWHGFDDQGPKALKPLFVPLDDRRQRLPVPPPVIVSGALLVNSGVGVPGTAPPAPTSIDRADQRVRFRPLDPIVVSGALASFPPVTFTAPPAPVNVDRADQRVRSRPLDAIVVSGALASFPAAPAVNPPAPFLVPLDERRRFLASLPPNVTVGFDDVAPPKPNLVEPDRRRLLPLDPFVATSAGAATAPAPATPPPPFIVPIDERGRFVVVLPATGQHGFVDPGPGPVGTTPPPAQNVDRVDPRYGSKPIDPLILSGVLVPFVPPPPPPTNAVQDMAPFISNW